MSIFNRFDCIPIQEDDSFINTTMSFFFRFVFIVSWSRADLDHVTYGLRRTKILKNCSKSFKIVEVLVLILIFIQTWRTRKSFLNPPLWWSMSFNEHLTFKKPRWKSTYQENLQNIRKTILSFHVLIKLNKKQKKSILSNFFLLLLFTKIKSRNHWYQQ